MNAEPATEYQIRGRRRFALQASILIAGACTVTVPIVVMAERHIFGQEPPGNQIALAGILAIIYTGCYLVVRTTSLIAASASFVVTTSVFMTLAVSVFTFLVGIFSGWSEHAQTVVFALCFLALTLVANAIFLLLSIRYAIAVRNEITVLSAIGGLAAAIFLPAMLAGCRGAFDLSKARCVGSGRFERTQS
jgi:hypothetical protein